MEGCQAFYSGTWQCFWGGIIIFFIIGLFAAASIEEDFGYPKELGIFGSITGIVFSLFMIFDVMIKCGG